MDKWSLGEIAGAMLLVGIPLVSLAGWVRRMAIDARAARRLKRAAVEREQRRRPAPGTAVIEGRVVEPESGELHVLTRREFGCLGGNLIHTVPPFEIELDDGTRRSVEVGDDPVIENLQLLAQLSSARTGSVASRDPVPLIPTQTGASESVALLRGRVRVAGVLHAKGERITPPPGASAVLTILGADRIQ
jgi:hypothetical protein